MIVAILVGLAAPTMAQTIQPFEMPKADQPPPPGTMPGQANPFRFPPRDPSQPSGPIDDLLNNMLRRAQPHLEGLARDMGGLVNEYAPVFEELSGLMDDIGNYEMPPERLPNGDILIRRKAGAPPPPPLEQLPNFLPQRTPELGQPVITPPDSGQIQL